eukprot:gene25303-30553_t
MSAVSSTTADDLMWSLEEARDMVKHYAVWPSFLGNRVAVEAQHGKGKEDASATADKTLTENKQLEALLWTLPAMTLPEQRRYVQQVRSKTSRKRQRDDDEMSDYEESLNTDSKLAKHTATDSKQQSKRQKTDRDHGSTGLLSSLYYRVVDWSRTLWGALGFATTSNQATAQDPQASQTDADDAAKGEGTIQVVSDLKELDKQPDEREYSSSVTSTSVPSSASVTSSAPIPFQHLVYSSIRESDSAYVLIPADVYGGEYSVYKGGDPTTTHSMATVRVLEDSKISAQSLLAFSRVQNQVSKAACLAFPVHPEPQTEGKASSADAQDAPCPEVQILTFSFRGVKEH